MENQLNPSQLHNETARHLGIMKARRKLRDGSYEAKLRDVADGERLKVKSSMLTMAILSDDLVAACKISDNSDMTIADLNRLVRYVDKHDLWLTKREAVAA